MANIHAYFNYIRFVVCAVVGRKDQLNETMTLRQQVAVLREQIGRLQVEREQLKATYDKALERANRRIAELEEK